MGVGSDFDPDQIFSRFDFATRPAVIAAVSGGSDSLAMLLLLQRWLERQASETRLVAVTVDHRLRPSSAVEAKAVGQFCAGRGIAHGTLAWTGNKPVTGVSVAARVARYGLLAEAAAAEDSDIIVTGHTADDQAETVAMRRMRGDGRGLAGMAPATLFDGETWIVRPLLTTARTRLRSFLQAENVAWIDDPTNVDTTYERPRVRARLEEDSGALPRSELLALAEEAAAKRVETGKAAARLIRVNVEQPMPGLFRLAPGFLSGPEEAVVLALQVMLAVRGGVEHLPSRETVAGLLAEMRHARGRATLSRTVVDARKDGIFLYRERRGLPPAMAAVDGVVWDGRHQLKVSRGDLLVVSGPTDGEGTDDALDAVPASICRAVLGAQPRLVDASGMAMPVEAVMAVPILAPWRQFLPSFDLALARAVASLIGAPEIPAPPFAGHNGEEG
jgi:tRNA(Ile)-lysidine synthase